MIHFPTASTVCVPVFWLADHFHVENYPYIVKYVLTETKYSDAKPMGGGGIYFSKTKCSWGKKM